MTIEGSLSLASVAGLLQMLCGERRSARLVVWGDPHTGTLILEPGRIRHAQYNELVGDDAVVEILRINDGVFRIDEAPTESPRTVRGTLTSLLWAASGGGQPTAGADAPPAPERPQSRAPESRTQEITPTKEVTDDELIGLLSGLDSQITRLIEGRARKQPSQVAQGLEEIANRVLAFLAEHLPRLRSAWSPTQVVANQATRFPMLRRLEVGEAHLSCAGLREALRAQGRDPVSAYEVLRGLAAGIDSLLALWFETLAQSLSTEQRRGEWREAFAAVRNDLDRALADGGEGRDPQP
jgi:Domain of unknown function (DUF4388)